MTDKITWTLKLLEIDTLTDYAKNPRSLTDAQFKQLKTSLDKFGMIDKPIINLDEAHTVIGGHQRLRVLRHEGVKACECWLPDRMLDEREVEELNIRLNKNTGAWDFEILANEWEYDDLLDWGFDEKELTGLDFGEEVPEDPGAQIDKAEELREKWGVVSGQLWQLGEHRLICGDCTDKAVVERVMGGEKADFAFTDPPYNVGVKYTEATNDNQSKQGFIQWCKGWVVYLPERYLLTVGIKRLCWWDEILCDPQWIIAWVKRNGQGQTGLGGTNKWDAILVYGVEQDHQTDMIELNNDYSEKIKADGGHPTAKPVELWSQIIERFDGRIIYEPFSGSGTTLIACERLHRKCRAIEISPAYVGVAIERFYVMTGIAPQLLDTLGMT